MSNGSVVCLPLLNIDKSRQPSRPLLDRTGFAPQLHADRSHVRLSRTLLGACVMLWRSLLASTELAHADGLGGAFLGHAPWFNTL